MKISKQETRININFCFENILEMAIVMAFHNDWEGSRVRQAVSFCSVKPINIIPFESIQFEYTRPVQKVSSHVLLKNRRHILKKIQDTRKKDMCTPMFIAVFLQ